MKKGRGGGRGGGGGGEEEEEVEGEWKKDPSPSLPYLTLGLTADPRQPVWEAMERERTPSTVLVPGGARCAAVQV